MKDLPMIEYEKPVDKTKSQWELRLQAEIEKQAEEKWYNTKPRQALADIKWDRF